MIATDQIDFAMAGVPVLADGAHCPICAAPMYIGRDDSVLVCLTHGEMSPDNYAHLWRMLFRKPRVSNADKMNPKNSLLSTGADRLSSKTAPPVPSVSGR